MPTLLSPGRALAFEVFPTLGDLRASIFSTGILPRFGVADQLPKLAAASVYLLVGSRGPLLDYRSDPPPQQPEGSRRAIAEYGAFK